MTEIDAQNDAVVEALKAAHDRVSLRHDAGRRRLLDGLATDPEPSVLRRGLLFSSVGATALVAAFVLLWVASPPSAAFAMERVADALQRVASFNYRMDETYASTEGEGRTIESVFEGRWRREPVCLWGTMKLWESPATATEHPGPRRLIVDVEEFHRAGERGMIIDHLKRHCWRTPSIGSEGTMRGGTPVAIISKVQGRRWRVLRELGKKQLEGREARGLLIFLDGSQPAVDAAPGKRDDVPAEGEEWTDTGDLADGADWANTEVELWYDPQTDLPIEFVNTRTGDDFETVTRYSGFDWNTDFEPESFTPATPEAYRELERSPFADDE